MYDGNPHMKRRRRLQGSAIIHRFGNFELFSSQNDLTTLKHWLILQLNIIFPKLKKLMQLCSTFQSVANKTLEMIVHWQRVGFVHGVMNTDNMSILGLTIDYGPYGWLEDYNPNWTPNTTDRGKS
jgi:uncharacterized protein YdiU (UPF0061 family)